MVTTSDLLNLVPSVGQRSSTFRFDLLDAGGAFLGTVEPDGSSTPTIENNVGRSIKRDLRNLVLTPSDSAAVNPISDRIAVSMVLQNSQELPWGLFLFVDGSRVPQSAGTWFRGSLLDQCFILDQPLPTSLGYQTDQVIADALGTLFTEAGIADWFVEPVVTTIAQPIAWPAGTSRLTVMNELAALAGCYSVFFSNSGEGRVEVIPDLAATTPTVTYAYGGNVYDGSILETDNILSSPNRYIVIDSAALDAPIVGQYDVPASAPHSAANRGFVVARVITEQGLGTAVAANNRARAAAAQDAADYSWVSFSSAPDPRHDTFDTIDFLGVRYREQRWSCPLEEGSVMTHDLKRVWS